MYPEILILHNLDWEGPGKTASPKPKGKAPKQNEKMRKKKAKVKAPDDPTRAKEGKAKQNNNEKHICSVFDKSDSQDPVKSISNNTSITLASLQITSQELSFLGRKRYRKHDKNRLSSVCQV